MPRDVVMKAYKISELGEKARERAIEVWREAINDNFLLDGWREGCLEELNERGFEVETTSRRVVSSKGPDRTVQEPHFYYSLSYSQGDGVAMYGRIDVLKWLAWMAKATEEEVGKDRAESPGDRQWAQEQVDRLKKIFEERTYDLPCVAVIENGNHYSHYNTMDFEWEDSFEQLVSDDIPEDDPKFVRDGVNPSPHEIEIKKLEDYQKELLESITESCRNLSKRFEREGYAELEWQLADEQVLESVEANEVEFTEDGRIFPR